MASRIFLICLAIWVLGVPAHADLCEPLAEYDQITDLVTKTFYDQTFRGLNWPSRVSFYRDQLKCETLSESMALTVNTLLSELHASHTGLYTKNDLDFWALNSIFSGDLKAYPFSFSGIWAVKKNSQWIARHVLPGSPAYRAGVRPGDMMLLIENKPFSPMGWDASKTQSLRFSRNGKISKAKVRANFESSQAAFLKAANASKEIKKINGLQIGYFHLWCGTHNEFLSSLNNALKEFGKAKVQGVIIDLRGGFGGADPKFLDELKNNSELALAKKVLLTDETVRSGKEWITAVFKKEKLGTVIGTKTAGAFLSGAGLKPVNGKYFLYVAGQEFKPDGIDPIEGIGVSPDIEILGCKLNCGDSDPQLEAALRFIVGNK